MLSAIEIYLAKLRTELDGMIPPHEVETTLKETRQHLEELADSGQTPAQAVQSFGPIAPFVKRLSRAHARRVPLGKGVAVALLPVVLIYGGFWGGGMNLAAPLIGDFTLGQIIVFTALTLFAVLCLRLKRVLVLPIAVVAVSAGALMMLVTKNQTALRASGGGHYLIAPHYAAQTANRLDSQLPVLNEAAQNLAAGNSVFSRAQPGKDLGVFGRPGHYRTPQYFYDQAVKATQGFPSFISLSSTRAIPFFFETYDEPWIHFSDPMKAELDEAKTAWNSGPGALGFVRNDLLEVENFMRQVRGLEQAGWPKNWLGHLEIGGRHAFGVFFWLWLINFGVVMISRIEIRKRRPWPSAQVQEA